MKKITFLFFILVSTLCVSQQKYQSLLWEITGNGLNKPSYLYGTMHVSKKVAFRLDDVFYKALNNSDCIALESDPTQWPSFNYEVMQNEMAYFSNYNSDFYTELFKLKHPEKSTIRASLRMDNKAINAYLYRKNSASDNFEEETYLDLFIFQAGKKNNKKIYGLEDLAESRYLTTKAAYNANKKNLEPWIQKLYARENPYLIQENLYRDRNLDLLDSIGAVVNTRFYRKNMLFIRNKNMVNSLEKLMPKQSVFAGVGAAHLPGENGMINLLRKNGYNVKALSSKQSDYSKTEKSKLDSLFIAPKLKRNYIPDGFIGLKAYDTLREFSFDGQTYYLDPDMTNGAYITLNRISRFLYLPNEKDHINLNTIDNLLFEDIPGDILRKSVLTQPYPGLSILNKTKKGEFQKYHIYQTPLEIIILKFAGRSDFVLKHEAKVFDSIVMKSPSTASSRFVAHQNKFEMSFPEYHVTSNMQNNGKKLMQAYKNDAYYFLQEAPLHDLSYIEEDSFEAKYFHHAFYKAYKLAEAEGQFKAGDYKTYESYAVLDPIENKNLYLKTIVKDASYYLLGYVGSDETEKTNFFKSFKFNTVNYEHFEKTVDTSLHFSVNTNAKAPLPNPYNYKSYKDNERKKEYSELVKSTTYKTKANEQISVSRRKFHDLQMYRHVDSLWNEIEAKLNYNRYSRGGKRFQISNRIKTHKDSLYTFCFSYWDSLSAKEVLVKNVLKKGVLFELRTMVDSISGPSTFIREFYGSFKPLDTLLGRSPLSNKTEFFLDALQANDSIILDSYKLIKFKRPNSGALVALLRDFEFEKDRLNIKSHLVKELIKMNLKNQLGFIEQLYYDSYSEPQTQTAILDGLLEANSKVSYGLVLQLMERDLPLNGVNRIFSNYQGKDSLPLKASLFPKLLQYSTVNEYKQPIYQVLARVKDSGLIKTKTYSKYKDQIIYDGKIEVKRSLGTKSTNYGYKSYLNNLSTYVTLIFPYRKERPAQDFFEKLLNVEDRKALVNYYVRLIKSKEAIPDILKEKIIRDEAYQYLLLEALADQKLLKKQSKIGLSQRQFARSKLISNADYESEKDALHFLMTRDFKTSSGEKATMYFFKSVKTDEYSGVLEALHYISFINPKSHEQLVVDYYHMSPNNGMPVDKTKPMEEQYAEIINLAIYKDRKRVTPSVRGGGEYYDY